MTNGPPDLERITAEPLLAIITTTNPNGSPQATPVWYYYDGKHFSVTSHSGRVKVRNLRRDPRVSLVVVDTSRYGTPLLVNGTAEIVEEGAQDATERVAVRYEGEEQGKATARQLAEYARSIGRHRVIIRIKPDRTTYGE